MGTGNSSRFVLSRRELLKVMGIGAGALALGGLAGCAKQSGSGGTSTGPEQGKPAAKNVGQVVICSWGGSTQALHKKHFFTPFEKATGIKVIDVSPFSYGKLKSMVQAGNPEWDVTIITDVGEAKRAAAEGLLEPIDYSIVHKDGLHPKAVGSYWCAGEFEAVVMAYHTSKWEAGTGPKSWADFWDTARFPGSRALHNWCVTDLEAALLADGVAPDKLYPLDVDRALKSLERLKPSVKTWWDVSAQGTSQQLLKDREVDLINGWTGRFGALITQGEPVSMEYGQALWTIAPWVVIKGAKNKENAMRFIDFISGPQPQASLHSELIYGPTNLKAVDLIDEKIRKLLPSHPDNLAKSIEVNTDYWGVNEAKVTEQFNAWLLKK